MSTASIDVLAPDTWFSLGAEVVSKVVAFREELHRNPELSLREVETTARIIRSIGELGLDEEGVGTIQPLAETGLCLRLHGADGKDAGGEVPTIAVRGDIDALPINEENAIPYRSEAPGIMHACGHDVHTAWALTAACLIAKQRPKGDVVVVFQPAEELGLGAALVLESGALDDVGMIFGGHVDPRWQIGQVVAQSGPVAAATDEFRITLRGAGGHGARPQLGRDPVVAGAAIVNQLQSIVSRRVTPGDGAVVTVGEFHAGTAPNIIPDTAHITGTLRSQSSATRSLLRRSVVETIEGLATASGVEAKVEFGGGTPPLVNDSVATEYAASAAADLLGEHSLLELPEPNMGGEDFAVYLERIPGAFVRVGSRYEGDSVVGAHTSRFLPRTECVFVGAAVLAEATRRAQDG